LEIGLEVELKNPVVQPMQVLSLSIEAQLAVVAVF